LIKHGKKGKKGKRRGACVLGPNGGGAAGNVISGKRRK